ncbi:MAG: formylglycine-generating enzyme family protein, partial [Planctomycetota bacterium]
EGWKLLLLPEDVLDLVPIGENPVTHLWEFYHLPSAWDGAMDPREIPIPQHQSNGSIAMTKATGIVFVLLPGGSFTMGAQKTDPKAPNYDPQAKDDEAPRRVQLAPFLLARHEVTQAQWTRMWTWYQDERDPGHYKAGSAPGGLTMVTHVHPVERVDWTMCNQLLLRYGLELPTEAQWEFGCRAGTTTPWVVEFAQLKDYANVADATARQIVSSWPFEDWDDGYAVHAPVGSFKANAFGLHDMHGNVWEWCRDWFGNYGSERKGDGLRTGGNTTHRVLRGGGFIGSAQSARSANRGSNTPQFRHDMMGFRASRSLSH